MNFSLNAYRVGVQKKFTNQKSSLFHCIKEDIELFGHGISIDPNTSLIVVLVVLAIGIVASIIFPGKDEEQSDVKNDTNA